MEIDDEYLKDIDPIKLISLAAQMLNWDIALPPEGSDGMIDGIVLGTQQFFEEELIYVDEYTFTHKDKDDPEVN